MENLQLILFKIWDVFQNWWWAPLPFVLWRYFKFHWRWWRWEIWQSQQKKVLLEIKMPKEILKPLKSMEQVFSAIWGSVFDPPDWFEYWFEGKSLDSIGLEMVSLQGEPHLYIRCNEIRRNSIESAVYSQYPDSEISIVEDYTKYVPQDSPNKNWELWGSDYILQKEDVYPIKTYSKFFEEQESAKEEKRIDPLSTLLEGMAKLGQGEQLWIQIAACPVLSVTDIKAGGTYDFVAKGREIADKLAKRSEKPKKKSILKEAAEILFFGKLTEEKKEESIIPPEMRLTPGEKEVVENIEAKVAKRCFKCNIRFLYIAKRDVYFGGAKGIPFGFFNQFATENLNNLRPYPKTLTKIKQYINIFGISIPIFRMLQKRRLFVKKRGYFFRTINRLPAMFPRSAGPSEFILNTEELATIFHFPGRGVASAPFVSRVESKRGEAPPGLPVE